MGKSIVKSKKAFYRFREDTSWNTTGKFGQFLTTFGDMENGWKKSFRPPKDENSATTARHARAVITLIITLDHA